VTLANVASDQMLVSDPITDQAIIRIPGDGLMVGVLVSCTAGSGKFYSHPMEGAFVA